MAANAVLAANTPVFFRQRNTKRKKSWERYEAYKVATTLAEFFRLGGWIDDLRNDKNKGFLENFPFELKGTEVGKLLGQIRDAALADSEAPRAGVQDDAAAPAPAPAETPFQMDVDQCTVVAQPVRASVDDQNIMIFGCASLTVGHIASIVNLEWDNTDDSESTCGRMELHFGHGVYVRRSGKDVLYGVCWATRCSLADGSDVCKIEAVPMKISTGRGDGLVYSVAENKTEMLDPDSIIGAVPLDNNVKGKVKAAMEQKHVRQNYFPGSDSVGDAIESFLDARLGKAYDAASGRKVQAETLTANVHEAHLHKSFPSIFMRSQQAGVELERTLCLQRRAALAFAAREPRLKITDDDFLLIAQDVQLDVLRYHRPGFTPGSSCFTMEEPRLSLDKNRRKSAAKRRAVDKWNDDASDDDDDDDGVDVDSEAEDDAPRTPNREESPPPREVWEASWRAREPPI